MTVGSEREANETRTQQKKGNGLVSLRLIDPNTGRVAKECIYRKFV